MLNAFLSLPSSTQTASGASGTFGSGTSVLDLQLTVTAASGTTPSLTLSVQWSDDGTNFGPVDTTADAFAALTATGTVVKSLSVKGAFFKLVWTITGTTPSFTFLVEAASN